MRITNLTMPLSPTIFMSFCLLSASQAMALDEQEIADVVEMFCETKFKAKHGDKPCKLIQENERTIVSGKWWKASAKELKGLNGITGRTQFYSSGEKAKTGTVYHTVYVDGKGYTSKHKLRKKTNFNQGNWERIK